MKSFPALWIFILIMSFPGILYSQNSAYLQEKIPLDSSITKDSLDNGLKYYIKVNKKPEDRAVLRLVVNAGSVLEDPDQLGLAHFVEHMGFNGTANFKKHELIDYMESIGMKFGPEVNAYTGFDQTVYMLDVPTDSAEILEKGFQILEDWAHNVSFNDDEIDKERGVIVEEWRLGRGATARIMNKLYPVIVQNSIYADRLPIGKLDVIKNFKHDTLRRFYRDWYRPDLMAVIAVGDFNKERIEQLIKKHFSKIKNPVSERERKYFPVPDNKGTLFTVATDPEATQNIINIYFKSAVKNEITVNDYRRNIIQYIYSGMLNERLRELSQKADPPFLYAYSTEGRFIRTKDFYIMTAVVKDSGIEKGLKAVLTEAERVRRYGFSGSELQRQKISMLRYIEKTYDERDKTESSGLASEYIRNFLENEPVPGIAYEYGLYKKLLPGISLEEVNKISEDLMTENNRVVAVSAPDKKGVPVPDKEKLSAVINEVEKNKITAYEDKVNNTPLLDKIPSGSEVINEKKHNELGITEWKLANGVRVVMKPTDFKNDEVLFNGFSEGGTSLVPDSEYIAAVTASNIINQSGAGRFNQTELRKMLAGKDVSVNTYIHELSEGIRGSASPKDLETMFQLIYLYFMQPRKDSTAFLSYKYRLKSYLQNKNLSPEQAFNDTLMVTLSNYNPRRIPLTEKRMEKMNLKESFQIYKERFADASDFTFVFVGNFKIKNLKPLVETYLGALPSLNRGERWKNLHINPPKGVIEKEVRKGIEPKSMVDITFTGPYEFGYQNNYEIESMRNVLIIKLREILREEKGGTYGVHVYAWHQKIPEPEYNISILFGCAPDRVNELVNTFFKVIDTLKAKPVADIYLTKVKEIQRRDWEVRQKENNFWLNTLDTYYSFNLDLSQILKNNEMINSLTKEQIMKTVQKYFNKKNYIKVVLYPEKS